MTDCLINFNYFYKKNIVGKYFMLTEVNDPLFFCIITNPDKNVFKAVNCSAIYSSKLSNTSCSLGKSSDRQTNTKTFTVVK